jgi:hypothetical protein
MLTVHLLTPSIYKMMCSSLKCQIRARSPTVPADTMEDPEGQFCAAIPLLALLLLMLVCPAASVLGCVFSEALCPVLLRCTNQCLATPVSSSFRPLSSSTSLGTQAGVPTWVPTGTKRLGSVPSPGLHASHIHCKQHSYTVSDTVSVVDMCCKQHSYTVSNAVSIVGICCKQHRNTVSNTVSILGICCKQHRNTVSNTVTQ